MWRIETERQELFDVNMMISMEVSASGSFTQEEIKESFHRAVAAFEILNTKIVMDDAGNAYYAENKAHQNHVSFSDKPLQTLIHEQERIRFQIENGEFLRLFASLNASGNNRFTFMLHHLGGDGKSLLYFIEAFFKSLNHEPAEFREIKLIHTDSLPADSKLPIFTRLFIHFFNRKWKKEKQVFTFEDMEKSFDQFWKSHKTTVEINTVPQAELRAALETCKQAKIGYTSYDIAGSIQNNPQKTDIGLAVDGREDRNRTMSNQATGISVQFRYDRRKTLTENAKRIHRLMRKKLNNNTYKYFILRFMAGLDPTLVDALNLESAGYFHSSATGKLADLLGFGSKKKDISITNLTAIDIPTEYGNLKIHEVTFVPPVVSYGKNIIGMITTDGKLIHTKHCYEKREQFQIEK